LIALQHKGQVTQGGLRSGTTTSSPQPRAVLFERSSNALRAAIFEGLLIGTDFRLQQHLDTTA
jgi:hypothetical protein